MKRFSTTLLSIAIALLMTATCQAAAKARIIVFSDCHTMAPALVTKQGTALAGLTKSDTRLTAQSATILQSMVAKALALKPQVVLVTGDLTKDGELLSHRYVVKELDKLTAAGIHVLVVPGNHDISNPGAVTFDGSATHPAATITRQQWLSIYKSMGYDPATSALDTASLSYAAEPVPGLVMLGIDTNRDEENQLKSRGDTANTYHNAGRIKASTLHWLADRARQARAQGKQVIAFAHHHVAEHFDSERRLLKNYVISNAQAAIDTLTSAGVHAIFTGHLHVTDAARAWNSQGTDSLTELATGSLVTYPLNYRVADIKGGTMHVTTASVASEKMLAEARTQIERMAPVMLKAKLDGYYDKIAGKLKQFAGLMSFGGNSGDLGMPSRDDLNQAIDEEIAPMAVKGVLLVLQGNEGQHGGGDAVKQVHTMAQKASEMMLPGMMGGMGGVIMEQIYPQIEAIATSILEDKNNVGTDHETTVDDHTCNVKL